MRGLLGVLVAAGVMAGTSMAMTTSAEAHWFDRGGCCTVAKKVYYRQPTVKLVPRVTYERVRSYRTVWVKKLYRDRCGCRKFYRSVAVQQPTVSVVKRVSRMSAFALTAPSPPSSTIASAAAAAKPVCSTLLTSGGRGDSRVLPCLFP